MKSRIGILTNQSAFSKGEYHFKKIENLKTIFLPEHGLFAELQDQVSGSSLKYNYGDLNIINLYGDHEESLFVPEIELDKLDTIIFDISDVGARYYTFLTTCFYIMQSVSKYNKYNKNKIEFIIHESKNPIGKKIEGTPLDKKYSSFVGVETVIHRHGLSIFELLSYYNLEFDLDLKLKKKDFSKKYSEKKNSFLWVPPSPNIPTLNTCIVYVGQCLLEGTNLSEGRGTTKPFEIFGAPFIDIQNEKLLSELNIYQKNNFYLRPLMFMPTFHKHQNKICGGFQLMVRNPKKFDSLLFSLHLIQTINKFYPEDFKFLNTVYEFRSDKSAIELLAGDDKILSFLNFKLNYKNLKEYFKDEENKWKKKINRMKIKT